MTSSSRFRRRSEAHKKQSITISIRCRALPRPRILHHKTFPGTVPITHQPPPIRPCLPRPTILPPCLQVFELDHGKAWRAVLTSVVSMSACLYLISISPWYMLPFAWALSGTAFTGVS